MTRLRLALWIPLLVFLAFVGVVFFGLGRSPEVVVESKMVGKPVPAFALPGEIAGRPGLTTADLQTGRPTLVNIFASWCIPCAVEAAQLDVLKQKGAVIHAVAIRDTGAAVSQFLARHGDPFAHIGFDAESRVQIAMGSGGVPETFVVDGRGTIRYQHIGEIRAEHVPLLLAELEKAR
jgi:cytochrome c biogenesis protein CcmG/thiol:disulfide interchange protein DsbE